MNYTTAQLRDWGMNQFETISKYTSEFHRRLLEIIVIDTFSQFHCFHSGSNSAHFADFVLKYGGDYSNLLSAVCPSVLYYNEFDKDPNTKLKLQQSRIIKADEAIAVQEANRLLGLLSEDRKKKAEKRYSYAALIYQMRNKLVHQATCVNMPIDFHDSNDITPYMACENEIKDGKLVFKGWTLNIPEEYIVAVGKECINNYIVACDQGSAIVDSSNPGLQYKWY